MYTQKEKSNENKSRAGTNKVSKTQNGDKGTFQFVDNRTEFIAQRKLQKMADNSPQLKAFQDTEREESLQKKFASAQKKENKTGLLYKLKSGVVQRVEKWWPTNAEHTAVTGAELAAQPGGSYVKRSKAGASDELLSTENDAWAQAKATSLKNRPQNKDLFAGTSEKMVTGDGNRTYLTKEGSKKAVSIVVTHTTDPQSQVETETGATIKVSHAHSTSGNYAQVNPVLKRGEHPKYKNDAEAKVHYLSLTPQGGRGGGGT